MRERTTNPAYHGRRRSATHDIHSKFLDVRFIRVLTHVGCVQIVGDEPGRLLSHHDLLSHHQERTGEEEGEALARNGGGGGVPLGFPLNNRLDLVSETADLSLSQKKGAPAC